MPKLKLDELITHIIDFADAQIAYDLVDKNPKDTIQVVLKY
jgi:threonine dehydrogenase-like Zn-dependent dehydrogenase